MLSKRKKESLGKYDIEKLYSVDEACALLKEISSSKKFDESIGQEKQTSNKNLML